jgi:hypothetical protein
MRFKAEQYAADMGMTPEDFFQKHLLNVVAEGTGGSQFSQLQSDYEVQPDAPHNAPIDGARLTALRRDAAGIEAPEKGITFRVDEEGRAIVTGPPRVRVPARFQKFANDNGLTLVVRRGPSDNITRRAGEAGPNRLFNVDGHSSSGKTQFGAAMPLNYRESGALYFGEIGNGPGEGPTYLDRTGKVMFQGGDVTGRQLAEVRAHYEGTDQWMKAPNGEPTKLNARQWLQVRTPMFKEWFGDWEIASLATSMRRSRGSDQASESAKAFIGKPLRNRETGVVATVSNGAFGKMKSRVSVVGSVSPQAHMQALGNIDKLFELAVIDHERGPKKQGDEGDIGNVQHYKVPMPFDGDVLMVKMLVKQFIDQEKGNRLYLVQAVEIENAGIVGEDPVVSGQFQFGDLAKSSPPSGVSSKLAQMIAAVNGNGVSKVVDENGEPLVVYHGTKADFTEFSAEMTGTSTDSGWYGKAMYFTPNTRQADIYAQIDMNTGNLRAQGSVMPVFLRAIDAFETDGQSFSQEYVDELKGEGYDAIFRVDMPGDEIPQEIVVFDPTQIKSAIGNAGTFSGETGNVLYQGEVADLLVQHNLTAENLLHAVKMGGIPVPSLAVTQKDNPLHGFGEITLLGSKDMVDPKGYAVVSPSRERAKFAATESPGVTAIQVDLIDSVKINVFQ